MAPPCCFFFSTCKKNQTLSYHNDQLKKNEWKKEIVGHRIVVVEFEIHVSNYMMRKNGIHHSGVYLFRAFGNTFDIRNESMTKFTRSMPT